MESNKILNADILDILFEGKNKEYGAYDLRKTYNRRFAKALISTAGVVLLVCTGYYVSSQTGRNTKPLMVVDDFHLDEVKTEKKVEPIVIPPPKTPPPAVAIIQSTPPRIVPDDKVKPEEVPPEQKDLDDTKIGTVNQKGIADDGITAPPASEGIGKGIVEAPKKEAEDDEIFRKVEIESTYPGGMAAWQRFLNKNFHYPDEAQNIEIQGVVTVQFIVDKEGNVSDVEAISGPEQGGLREEAIRVIKKSGKWTPAVQNGRQVRSYKRQPITFRIDN